LRVIQRVIIFGVAVALSGLVVAANRDNPKNWRGEPPEESFLWKSNPCPSKAYTPGAYGRVKDAPMFICWREWDGEIRIGGVAKSLSGQWSLGDVGEEFAGEIQGPSGCVNHEQLLFGYGTTNIVVATNYTGTIQIGTNFFHLCDLHKP
jgi:hypothetical protein